MSRLLREQRSQRAPVVVNDARAVAPLELPTGVGEPEAEVGVAARGISSANPPTARTPPA